MAHRGTLTWIASSARVSDRVRDAVQLQPRELVRQPDRGRRVGRAEGVRHHLGSHAGWGQRQEFGLDARHKSLGNGGRGQAIS
jgi:hypothetical protein